jgi:hypothetical protein
MRIVKVRSEYRSGSDRVNNSAISIIAVATAPGTDLILKSDTNNFDHSIDNATNRMLKVSFVRPVIKLHLHVSVASIIARPWP